MKAKLKLTYTGFNECEISEYTVSNDFKKDHLLIKTLDKIKGFSVFFIGKLEMEDFLFDKIINGKKSIDKRPIKAIYEQYANGLYDNYIEHTKRLERVKKAVFLTSTLQDEKDSIKKIEKYLYLIKYDNKEFIDLCKNYIDWLNSYLNLKPEVKPPQLNENTNTFEYLFIDKKNAQKLKNLLETTHYIDENSNWIYGGAKYDLAKIYYILKKETQILKQKPASKQLPIFYKEFKITGYTMNNLYSANKHLYTQEKKEYDELYKNLQPRIIKGFA